MDIDGYSGYYILSQYGFEEDNIFSKEMSKLRGASNVFTVTLSSSDTLNLEEGTYTAKIVFENDGEYYKRARGVFNVHKDNNIMSKTEV